LRKKHGFLTCIECEEVFRCEIFLRRKVTEWIPAAFNLRMIKEVGLGKWLKEQKERQALLESLLKDYNEGRSMSFYCKACSRMPIELIDKAVKQAKGKFLSEEIDASDIKSKAKIMRAVIKDIALPNSIKLD
jgi:hypothetical protein